MTDGRKVPANAAPSPTGGEADARAWVRATLTDPTENGWWDMAIESAAGTVYGVVKCGEQGEDPVMDFPASVAVFEPSDLARDVVTAAYLADDKTATVTLPAAPTAGEGDTGPGVYDFLVARLLTAGRDMVPAGEVLEALESLGADVPSYDPEEFAEALRRYDAVMAAGEGDDAREWRAGCWDDEAGVPRWELPTTEALASEQARQFAHGHRAMLQSRPAPGEWRNEPASASSAGEGSGDGDR